MTSAGPRRRKDVSGSSGAKTSPYEERLRRHYAPLVERHGGTYQSVDWGSARGQELRFRVLLEGGDFASSRVLDVGCGVGHLVDYLERRGFGGRYLGVDMVPEMVATARRRHPGWDFVEGTASPDISDFKPNYVVASGLFTFATPKRVEQTIASMFSLTSRVLAFNTLSTWGDTKVPGEFHADPLRLLEYCRALTRRVVLRHDYMPHDFTMYLYRDDAQS